jgi:hypothetical protein
MVVMLHNVHTRREREEGSRHQQQRLRLQISFQREILLDFTLSGTICSSATWLVDGGASCHMTGARELFDSFTNVEIWVPWKVVPMCL